MDYVSGQVKGVRLYNKEGEQLDLDGQPLPDGSERPASVPEEARWDPSDPGFEWIVGQLDQEDKRHGFYRMWTVKGQLHGETDYVHGEIHGKNINFHPDGTKYSEGIYLDGVMTQVDHYRCEGESPESFPDVAEEVVRMQTLCSQDGKYTISTRFYDNENQRITTTGIPLPPRPENVPENAGYLQQWVQGEFDRSCNHKVGTWKYWNDDGQIVCEEEITYERVPISTVHYFEDGHVEKSYRYHKNGKRAEWLWYHDNHKIFVDEKSDVQGNILYKARWSDTGKLREETTSTYDDNGLVTRTESDNGALVLKAERKEGKLIVTLLNDDENKPEAVGAIVDGCLSGLWDLYAKDGGIRRSINTSGLEIEASPLADKLKWPLQEAAFQLGMKDVQKLDELAGVEDIQWDELESAYNDCEKFPDYIRALVLEEPYARRYAFSKIYGEIEHQNTVYVATARVIPFLTNLLNHPNCDRHSIISMFYDVGSCAAPYEEEAPEWDSDDQIAILGTLKALDEAWPTLWAMMPDADDELRQQIVLLGQFPTDSDGVVQKALLDFIAAPNESEVLRSCAVNALANRNNANAELLKPILSDENALVRTTAAIACGLCFGPASPPEILKPLQTAIECWKELSDSYQSLPFVDTHLLALLALSATSTGKSDIRGGLLPLLRNLLEEVDSISATTFGRGLLSMTFGPCEKPFAPSFIETLDTLAKSRKFFDFNVNAHEVLREWGLPTEPEELLELVATLGKQAQPEDFLHSMMHD